MLKNLLCGLVVLLFSAYSASAGQPEALQAQTDADTAKQDMADTKSAALDNQSTAQSDYNDAITYYTNVYVPANGTSPSIEATLALAQAALQDGDTQMGSSGGGLTEVQGNIDYNNGKIDLVQSFWNVAVTDFGDAATKYCDAQSYYSTAESDYQDASNFSLQALAEMSM